MDVNLSVRLTALPSTITWVDTTPVPFFSAVSFEMITSEAQDDDRCCVCMIWLCSLHGSFSKSIPMHIISVTERLREKNEDEVSQLAHCPFVNSLCVCSNCRATNKDINYKVRHISNDGELSVVRASCHTGLWNRTWSVRAGRPQRRHLRTPPPGCADDVLHHTPRQNVPWFPVWAGCFPLVGTTTGLNNHNHISDVRLYVTTVVVVGWC